MADKVTDSLSLTTDLPFSGAGSASPEAAAGNADYSAWPWESVLATVLGIGIPDRSEVLGQPWLIVASNGQGGSGMHEIWSASWGHGGASSIQAYLNPAVYAAGGAWDQFLNAPAPALADIAAGNFSALTVNPRTFGSAKVAVADVTAMLAQVSLSFDVLQLQTMLEIQGSLAEAVTDLLGGLSGITSSLHDQLVTPTVYSDSIGLSGEAAAAFLTSINTAYTQWVGVTEHSPLGAIVEALIEIASQDASGAWVITNPKSTPYGDLTTAAGWATVEQQAKTLWTGAVAGDSDGFGGLDPLGRSALAQLVTQYDATITAVVPVIGPAPPSITPKPVGGTNPSTGTAAPLTDTQVNSNFVSLASSGATGGNSPAGAGQAAFTTTTLLTANVATASPSPATGTGPSAAAPNTGADASLQPSFAAANDGSAAVPSLVTSGQVTPGLVTALGGPITPLGPDGTSSRPARVADLGTGRLADPSAETALLDGAIGGPGRTSEPADRSAERGRKRRPHHDQAGIPALPAAGFAIGKDLGGAAITRAAMPSVQNLPVTATVSTQLVPSVQAGATPAVGAQAAVGPAGGLASPGASAVLPASGAESSALPPTAMPGTGALGSQVGQAGRERQRLAYLPEDDEFWGTAGTGIGSIGTDGDDEPAEPDFAPNPATAGIGSDRSSDSAGVSLRPDRRMP